MYWVCIYGCLLGWRGMSACCPSHFLKANSMLQAVLDECTTCRWNSEDNNENLRQSNILWNYLVRLTWLTWPSLWWRLLGTIHLFKSKEATHETPTVMVGRQYPSLALTLGDTNYMQCAVCLLRWKFHHHHTLNYSCNPRVTICSWSPTIIRMGPQRTECVLLCLQ